MKGFVKYVALIPPNMTKYMDLSLVDYKLWLIKSIVCNNILYNSPHFCENLAYVFKYYYLHELLFINN